MGKRTQEFLYGLRPVEEGPEEVIPDAERDGLAAAGA